MTDPLTLLTVFLYELVHLYPDRHHHNGDTHRDCLLHVTQEGETLKS